MKSIYFRLTIGFIIISAIVYAAIAAGDVLWKSDLKFSHKLHADENEIECVVCHEKSLASKSSGDDLRPKKATCYECHDEKDSECGMCHENPDDPEVRRRPIEYTPTFSHEAHLGRDIKCDNCHIDAAQKESLGQMHLPKMESCMNCHSVSDEIDDCYVCHRNTDRLKPYNHSELWLASHGIYKTSGIQDCSACHTENYCTDCHEGENLFAESHPPEFILTHSMSFRIRESNCYACHEGNEYCIECHIDVNHIEPISHSMPNWQWPISDSPLHGEEGRGNVDYCATCHRESDEYCAACHDDWK